LVRMEIFTDLARGIIEKLLQVGDAKVGNTDVPHFPGAHQLLQLAPGVDEVPVVVMLLAIIWESAARPVHKVKVDVFKTQVLQGGVDSLRNALVPRVVELGCDPKLLARDAGGANACAYLRLVAICKGRVNVPIASTDGRLDSGGGGIFWRLPRAQADGGDLIAGSQRIGLLSVFRSHG
jgi:hypothetical protein